MSNLTFSVYVKPEPQGSMKYIGHRKGRPVLTSDNVKLHRFRDQVGYAALHARGEAPMWHSTVPLMVTVCFSFLRPKSAKNRLYPTVKPDCDKLGRGLLDSLTGVLYEDDAQVVGLNISKRYAELEMVSVCIGPML